MIGLDSFETRFSVIVQSLLFVTRRLGFSLRRLLAIRSWLRHSSKIKRTSGKRLKIYISAKRIKLLKNRNEKINVWV